MSLVRWSGFVAMLGGVLCVLLTPIQASIYSGDESPPLVLTARPLLDAADRLHAAFGPRLDLNMYYFYGRMFFLVYLAAIVGLVGLHTLHSRGVRRERMWFRLVVGGLVLALVGDVVAYWGGRGDISESPVQGLGFTVEMLAVLVVLIGSVFYGRITLRENVIPNWAAWLFPIAGPTAILVVLLTGYIPHGAMLPFSLATAVAGYFLLTRGRSAGVPSGYLKRSHRSGAGRSCFCEL